MSTRNPSADRRRLLDELAEVGRAHSDATVLFHTTIADRLGLHATDWKAMSVLQRRGPLTAGEIAAATGLTTASVTALVDRLERRGLARRSNDPDDRRRVIVEVTPEAVQAFAALLRQASRSVSRLWESYSTEELAVIADFLRRNAQRLHAETERLAHEVASPPRRAPAAAH